jgi:heme exporter protein A
MISTVSARGLSVGRGDRLLLEGLDFELASGEVLALMGPNGAGKTSLLRALAGFIAPAAGVIAFRGAAGDLDNDEARRLGVHLVGHLDALKSQRSARDELLFQVRWTGGAEAAALAAAETFGLARMLDLAVRQLSAGQRRRLALARLIASPRPLWLLDEPLAPLDQRQRALFGDLMAAHVAAGGLVLAAVHDPLPIPARVLEVGP